MIIFSLLVCFKDFQVISGHSDIQKTCKGIQNERSLIEKIA